MNDMQVKPGDVVSLRSGGPAMTIAKLSVGPNGATALCLWFQGEAMPHEREFPLATLDLLEDVDGEDDHDEEEDEEDEDS